MHCSPESGGRHVIIIVRKQHIPCRTQFDRQDASLKLPHNAASLESPARRA